MRLKEGLAEPDDGYEAYKFHRNKLAVTGGMMFLFHQLATHVVFPFGAGPEGGYVALAAAGLYEFIRMNGIVKKLNGGAPME